ncbi:hypothetical protein [Vitiosangium sp. GDMCC 1.1324]|uniref:hypothetical protein n=1 Tax=Vitiosangium sp. (strain GDMCC 1.1324) TaxID=2138576 RepID=UPI000D336FD2|nr:hypothetical protein [Vitiosangium sp. GDMCC 1.1324]PTL80850.1 hypothetical protein DAT35_26305 [Vitiosangium sp. GDMCC 1.1324]
MTDDLIPASLHFYDRQDPLLPSGTYDVAATLSVTVDGATVEHGTQRARFAVGGERFALSPKDVCSMYPPDGSRGDFHADLPHVVLARDTLPWERSAGKGQPWLALLLLREMDAPYVQSRRMTLAEFRERCGRSAPLALEEGREQDAVTVLELDARFASECLPKADELDRFCHVREEVGGAPGARAAVVVGLRLPASGRHTMHLVSLEDHGWGDGPWVLVSLWSWTFTSEPVSEDSGALLAHLVDVASHAGLLRPEAAPADLPDDASRKLQSGLVLLPHHLAAGGTTASWYGGPLVPSPRPPGLLGALPASCADALLLYYEKTGMFDVSYAAAWELGRLLALQNRRVSTQLSAWRRTWVHHAHRLAAVAGSHGHLPQIQRAAPLAEPEPPPELVAWVEGLGRLEGVPFRYLVADERALPAESIRFFHVDPAWLAALLDGALSVVRPPNATERSPAERALLARVPERVLTGFVMRSAAVTGWQELQVEAQGVDGPLDVHPPMRPAPSIQLVVFRGEVRTLRLRQRVQSLHLSVARFAKGLAVGGLRALELRQVERAIGHQLPSGSAFAAALLHRPAEVVFDVRWSGDSMDSHNPPVIAR